jgi:hypothetical protein
MDRLHITLYCKDINGTAFEYDYTEFEDMDFGIAVSKAVKTVQESFPDSTISVVHAYKLGGEW